MLANSGPKPLSWCRPSTTRCTKSAGHLHLPHRAPETAGKSGPRDRDGNQFAGGSRGRRSPRRPGERGFTLKPAQLILCPRWPGGATARARSSRTLTPLFADGSPQEPRFKKPQRMVGKLNGLCCCLAARCCAGVPEPVLAAQASSST